MADFSVRMHNQLQFSTCDAPCRPITEKREETLAVALHGDLLTVTAAGSGRGNDSRIYAQRTVSLPGLSTFMILPRLPSRTRDDCFFPALGTVVLLDGGAGGKHRLHAVGIDTNSGRCHGWIFDAVET
jgi:hypothetical protein